MTVFNHEMRRGLKALIIWTATIASMMLICIFIYPEMGSQMSQISNMFADMGAFTSAFGMDKLNFGEFLGFYGIECGNMMGLGGALFAALMGISIVSKEEKEQTAEFLLTHPLSRNRILTEKFLAAYAQITALNLAVTLLCVLSTLIIGEEPDWGIFLLLHLAFYLLQLEICAVCSGISVFLRSSGIGIGLGVALLLYFLNLLSNITSKVEFFKWFTPFAYAESSQIINSGKLEMKYLLVGLAMAVAAKVIAYAYYNKKDIN